MNHEEFIVRRADIAAAPAPGRGGEESLAAARRTLTRPASYLHSLPLSVITWK